MIKNFRTYEVAVKFYQECQMLRLPKHLRDQLDRASSSIALNLAEGYGKGSGKDQKRFFQIALGSLRECEAILTLTNNAEARVTAHRLGGMVYKLIQY